MLNPIRAVVIACLLAAAGPAWSAPSEGITPEQRFDLGLRYMRRGNYPKALEQFNRIRNFHRDDPIAIRAELAIADLHFEKEDFEEARLAYEDFARLHPRYAQLDYVVFRIGECLFRRAPKIAARDQSPTRQAVNVWTGFEARFPNSEYHDEVADRRRDAQARLAKKEFAIAQFYAGRGAWLSARRRAEDLVRKYPDSTYAPRALVLAARGYHAWGMVGEAQGLRERLTAEYSEPALLAELERALARPPGSPPQDQMFPRPYRVAGGASPGAATAPPQ